MNSMTGFGRATVQDTGRSITIELKSVNHRYLDINLRLHRSVSYIDDTLRGLLKGNLKRGHIDVYVYYENNSETTKSVEVDKELAKAYYSAVSDISDTLSMNSQITAMDIARIPDVITMKDQDDDEEKVLEIGTEAMKQAVASLVKMREIEGEKLKTDLTQKLDLMKKLLEKVEEVAPTVVDEYREKLENRIGEILKNTNIEVDEARMSTEVAFFADRSSIDEELQRLNSHIELLRDTFNKNEPIGRQLDFIVQEVNREVNTICSKSSNIEITNTALEMKNTVEKIREQIQNIE